MKTMYALIFITILLVVSCDVSNEGIVGREGDTEIYNVSFTVDNTYVDGASAKLVAEGKVKNNGRGTITAPWYVEAQFYTDSTFTTKLGGNYTRINVPLSSGQQTFWTIKFSSSQVNVANYPYFRVSDLRAIYRN